MNFTREQKSEAARNRMAELAAKFMNRTQDDIAAMRSAHAALERGVADPLAEIRHLAHRMVGTGATLGFESLSDRAARIEALAESCVAGSLPDERLRAELAVAIDVLESELHRLRGQ
jgi:HPt (histidine-containing phosphotransfer) domain-containing protein